MFRPARMCTTAAKGVRDSAGGGGTSVLQGTL